MNGSCSGPTWSTPEQHDGSARPPSCEAYSMRALSCSARNIKTSRIVCDDTARVSKIRWRTHDDDGDFVATFTALRSMRAELQNLPDATAPHVPLPATNGA